MSEQVQFADSQPELKVTLVRTAYVTPRVSDENGTRVVGAQVSASSKDVSVFCDVNGQFRLPVEAGRQTVVAKDPAGRAAEKSVDVADEQTLTQVSLTMADPHVLKGRVLLSDGVTPAPDAKVSARLNSTEFCKTFSDLIGHFQLDGLPKTFVAVSASLSRGQRAEVSSVEPDNDTTLELTLSKPASL